MIIFFSDNFIKWGIFYEEVNKDKVKSVENNFDRFSIIFFYFFRIIRCILHTQKKIGESQFWSFRCFYVLVKKYSEIIYERKILTTVLITNYCIFF